MFKVRSPLGSSLGNSLNLSLVSNAFPGPADCGARCYLNELAKFTFSGVYQNIPVQSQSVFNKHESTPMSSSVNTFNSVCWFFPRGEVLSFLLLLTHRTAKICLNVVWP